MTKISICIPVYNMGHCIERTIQSALRQDYPDFEVILADNQSSDGTYEKASAISDPRLIVLRNPRNLGPYGNHQRCLEVAKGEWVKYLHGDDELLPNCLSEMMEAAQNCPADTALVSCGAIKVDGDNREIFRTYVPPALKAARSAPAREFIWRGNIIGTPTMTLIHRERLLEAGGFDLSLEPACDGDCWVNLMARYPWAVVPAHLVVIRDDPPSLLRVRGSEVVRGLMYVVVMNDKWHRKDPASMNLPMSRTPFSVHLCHQSFRFWDSAFFHILCGNPIVLKSLVRVLLDRKMLVRSLWFYIKKRLQWKNSHTLYGKRWDEDFVHLLIS